MRNTFNRRTRITAMRHPIAVRGLVILFFLCVTIKLAISLGGDTLAEDIVSRLVQTNGATEKILSFELGGTASGEASFLSALIPRRHISDNAAEPESSISVQTNGGIEMGESTPAPIENPDDGSDYGGLFYMGDQPEASDRQSELPSAPPAAEPSDVSAADVSIDNTTDYEIDIQALISEPLNLKLTDDGPAVLIIHTHTSEAYTQTEDETYEPSDPFRTEDKSKNIVRVGDELAAAFEERGIGVVHDRRSYDYPSYTGSYSRTYSSVQAYLKQYPSIKLIIDLHRDSITAADGSQYKTLAQVGDATCSQVMLVVGSDAAGLEHPAWRENLKLALSLQLEMNALTPTLARPVRISKYRYNQQVTTGSLIVEVGCAGNTLSESVTAVRYFADAAANVFSRLYDT